MSVIDFGEKRFQSALKKAHGQSGGGTEIDYQGGKVIVPTNHIHQALHELSQSEEKRLRIMRSVNEYLRKSFKKVIEGKASHKVAMNVSQDIAIWYANKLLTEEAQPQQKD